ncbi:MAG: Kdo hydroxylase family protein [Betaproteobacteria bacterium]|nr:Kdo hydroxylase family protein [Betaproteobacteria bacterium]
MPAPTQATDVASFPIAGWNQALPPAEQQRATLALESGSVLFFPKLRFALLEGEERLLSPAAAGQAKNVSLDPASGTLRGSGADEEELRLLQGMMTRFAAASASLLRNVLPRYAAALEQARTSYRPVEVAGRSTSWRKDDTRLHVDSFPSSPTRGRRILRVFANLNPHGQARTWRIGEPFEEVARRFVGSIPAPLPGSRVALSLLGVTRSPRSAYDHYMLRLHDCMKADADYQSHSAQRRFDFPPGSAWIVYTDQVSHAAMTGQYALEQTYHLPVEAMQDPARSPLRVLERQLGRALA